MKTSVIIPVYNEEKTVKEIIEKVLDLDLDKEVIVVDDGSKDKSWEIIKKQKGIKKIKHEVNLGKGAAVRTGIKNSTGEIVLIQDADMELDPSQIPILIEPILKNEAEVVYGSRNIREVNGNDKKRDLLFFLGGNLVSMTTNLLFGTKLTDEPCGYKVFKANVIKSIEIKGNRFEWEPEVTAKIAKKGIKIHEVPIVSNSRSIKEGKKLRRRDGIKAVYALIKYRFFN